MSRVSGKLVETKPVRELLEIAENEIAGKGMFITSGSFSEDARKYGLEHQRKMFLIDGEKFLYMLKKLPEDKQQLLLNIATEGDFTSPTCPSCGAKMVWRKVGKLWGCEHSPRCKATIKVEK
jgi:restriction system protein